MRFFRNIYPLLCLFLLTETLAQSSLPFDGPAQDGKVPSVYMIGQFETSYENLILDHNHLLLGVFDNDMSAAYNHWLEFLVLIESYATLREFDIKGIKLWMNVFWNADGSLKHIVYHLKPKSRNIQTDELTAFFDDFIEHHSPRLKSDYKFAHYGSAAFPVFPEPLQR